MSYKKISKIPEEKYVTKRVRQKNGYYAVTRNVETGKIVTKSKFRTSKTVIDDDGNKHKVKVTIAQYQDINMHKYNQRQARNVITKTELKRDGMIIPSHIEMSEYTLRFSFEYEVKVFAENSDGNDITRWITICDDKALTKVELDREVKKMMENEYHIAKIKKWKCGKLWVNKGGSK